MKGNTACMVAKFPAADNLVNNNWLKILTQVLLKCKTYAQVVVTLLKKQPETANL